MVPAPPGSWLLDVWLTTAHGHVLSVFSPRLYPLWAIKEPAQPGWMARQHLTLWISYQPAGRFWWFQAAEGGALLLLALLLAAGTIWLVRRRAA